MFGIETSSIIFTGLLLVRALCNLMNRSELLKTVLNDNEITIRTTRYRCTKELICFITDLMALTPFIFDLLIIIGLWYFGIFN